MHELGLMNQLLGHALAAADGGRICSLTVRLGPLSGVVPESLRFAFEALREGTAAADATLHIQQSPPVFHCSACGAEYEAAIGEYACPSCRNPDGDLVHGHECDLISMEVEDV